MYIYSLSLSLSLSLSRSHTHTHTHTHVCICIHTHTHTHTHTCISMDALLEAGRMYPPPHMNTFVTSFFFQHGCSVSSWTGAKLLLLTSRCTYTHFVTSVSCFQIYIRTHHVSSSSYEHVCDLFFVLPDIHTHTHSFL